MVEKVPISTRCLYQMWFYQGYYWCIWLPNMRKPSFWLCLQCLDLLDIISDFLHQGMEWNGITILATTSYIPCTEDPIILLSGYSFLFFTNGTVSLKKVLEYISLGNIEVYDARVLLITMGTQTPAVHCTLAPCHPCASLIGVLWRVQPAALIFQKLVPL